VKYYDVRDRKLNTVYDYDNEYWDSRGDMNSVNGYSSTVCDLNVFEYAVCAIRKCVYTDRANDTSIMIYTDYV